MDFKKGSDGSSSSSSSLASVRQSISGAKSSSVQVSVSSLNDNNESMTTLSNQVDEKSGRSKLSNNNRKKLRRGLSRTIKSQDSDFDSNVSDKEPVKSTISSMMIHKNALQKSEVKTFLQDAKRVGSTQKINQEIKQQALED